MDIHIPTPCQEDWNAMAPVGGGRHCALCQHVVIDLTTMTDAEVLAYLQQQPGRVCGRIQAHRLAAPVPDRPKPLRRTLAYFALALALVFGVPVAAQAQHNQESAIHQTDSTGSITGRVLEDGEPLGDVTIEVKQGESTVNGAYSESDGSYVINGVDTGVYQLRVTYLDRTYLLDSVVVIESKSTKIKDIDTEKDHFEFLGERYEDVVVGRLIRLVDDSPGYQSPITLEQTKPENETFKGGLIPGRIILYWHERKERYDEFDPHFCRYRFSTKELILFSP